MIISNLIKKHWRKFDSISNILEKHITIEATDGFPLAATTFIPDSNVSKTILLCSALGVPRYIYFKLARFFAEKDFAVLTFDYRGIYKSQSDEISGSEMKMVDWGKLDIDSVLNWTLNEWNPDELIYIGHSCGGQLLGLAANSVHIDRAVFIASQTGYWKLWPTPYHWGVRAVWNIIPLITPWFDEFPARALGLSSVNIPSGVAKQWAQWGQSPNYLWDHINKTDRERYQGLSFPLLSLGFKDDLFFGPPAAVEKLITYYPATQSELNIINPSDYQVKSLGHFGFLNDKFRDSLWQELLGLINR